MSEPPDPHDARTPAEFAAALRQLRKWADRGRRSLARRTIPDRLPPGTRALPPEESLIDFVRACGADPATTEAWRTVRERLARTAYPDQDEGQDADQDQDRDDRDRFRYAPMATTSALAAAGVLALALWPGTPLSATTPPAPKPSPPRTVVVGIHPADAPDRCLTAGQELGTAREVAVQRSCASAPLPEVRLEPDGAADVYRIEWHGPDDGPRCLGVDRSRTGPGALLSPGDCTGADSGLFQLEPSGGGHRLRPLHSGLCVGFLPPYDEGAEAVQTSCTGGSDQVFHVSPR
ncbi:XRE family transcriptional regulator [Streptomyces sp. NPDC000410]|uniref:XRE family transcriptional regulator n=1 Tax=Streptomyces sp. NPDC000410 TaxID=3154254 RepID=UPI0033319A05